MSFDLVVHLHSEAPQAQLDALFWRVATPGSADYLNFYKSPESLASLFGATDADVAEVSAWLSALNGTDVRVSAVRDRVTATFPTSQPTADAWSARGLPLRHLQPPSVHIVTRRDALRGTEKAMPRTETWQPRESYTVRNMKTAWHIPTNRMATNPKTLQMVWGPGTFGFSPASLAAFGARECPGLDVSKVTFDTSHHGTPGGDNWGEGTAAARIAAPLPLRPLTVGRLR